MSEFSTMLALALHYVFSSEEAVNSQGGSGLPLFMLQWLACTQNESSSVVVETLPLSRLHIVSMESLCRIQFGVSDYRWHGENGYDESDQWQDQFTRRRDILLQICRWAQPDWHSGKRVT